MSQKVRCWARKPAVIQPTTAVSSVVFEIPPISPGDTESLSRQPSSESLSTKEREDRLLACFREVGRTAVAMPYRPDYGTSGTLVEIQANYFEMKINDNLILHAYEIKIAERRDTEGKPFADPKGSKLKQIIKIMLDSTSFKDNKENVVFTDFQRRLISLNELPEKMRNQTVEYFHEADGAARDNPQVYNLHLVPASDFPALKISDLMEFLKSTATIAHYPARETMIQALNILTAHHTISSPKITIIGAKRAFPHDKHYLDQNRRDLGKGIEALRGYFSSVRLASYRPLVNVNISHGAFYKGVRLTELMEDCGLRDDPDLNDYAGLESFIKGLKVRTNHAKDKQGNRVTMTRTISGFARAGTLARHKVDFDYGSPFMVWFCLEDFAEFDRLKANKARDPDSKKRRNEMTQLIKRKGPKGKDFVSVGEFFDESTFHCWLVFLDFADFIQSMMYGLTFVLRNILWSM